MQRNMTERLLVDLHRLADLGQPLRRIGFELNELGQLVDALVGVAANIEEPGPFRLSALGRAYRASPSPIPPTGA